MAETTAYIDFRGDYNDIDGKGKSKSMEKRLSGRIVEAMKILRVKKPMRQPSLPSNQIIPIYEPPIVISELPCPDPAIELPCRDFVQDNRNVSDMHREHQQALAVTWPDVELKRIKRTRGERTPETCEWLLAKDPFVNWYDGGAAKVLRIIGDPDMGKTMLITFLIERLSTTLRVTPGMTLAYHFCDNESQSCNTALAIVKTILYQIFQQWPQHCRIFQSSYDAHGRTLFRDFSLMWSVLLDIIQAFDDDYLFILIDALDECSPDDRDLLLDGLIGISQSSKNVKFLFTCRPVEWTSWATEAPKVGLGSMTIDFRDISGDVKKVVDEKLPPLRQYYGWDDSVDFQIRSGLNNITGTFPVSGLRFLSEAVHAHSSDFLSKLIEHLRIIPAHLDLKRSLSDHAAKEIPWNDARSTRSLPPYTGRPASVVSPTPHQPTPHKPASEAEDDVLDGFEALRSNMSSAAGLNRPASDLLSSEPFSIVPTPATSRNPSHTKPAGWQSPVSTVEEGDEANDGEQPSTLFLHAFSAHHRDGSFACPDCVQPQAGNEAARRYVAYHRPLTQNPPIQEQETVADGPTKRANDSTSETPSLPASHSDSSRPESQPLFNPSHPISIFCTRARSHAKDGVLLLLLLLVLRPFWVYINWTWVLSISAGLAGIAYHYLLYPTTQATLTDHTASPNGSSHQGSLGSSIQSSTFSGFTSSIIHLFRQIFKRGPSKDEDGSPDSAPPDPESGYTPTAHCSPDGLSFWVLACLFTFTLLGGFAIVAQTIACVRVHDESLLPGYTLPTRDDTDHWELLSTSSFVLVNIFLQSAVSVMHIRRSKDASRWLMLWVCNAICLLTIPCALKFYLHRKYVSKAVTGAGNLIQVVVTFFTILKLEQIAQNRMWALREAAMGEYQKGMAVLREENLRLRTAAVGLSPPLTPPGSSC